jgi:hypothetical protein
MAKQPGMNIVAKPTNRVGGWITIQKFWSDSFRPRPSSMRQYWPQPK